MFEENRHPEPRRRRRISKLQAFRISRSFAALRRLRMTVCCPHFSFCFLLSAFHAVYRFLPCRFASYNRSSARRTRSLGLSSRSNSARPIEIEHCTVASSSVGIASARTRFNTRSATATAQQSRGAIVLLQERRRVAVQLCGRRVAPRKIVMLGDDDDLGRVERDGDVLRQRRADARHQLLIDERLRAFARGDEEVEVLL